MKFFLLSVMLTACAAIKRDLQEDKLVFPRETGTDYAKLLTSHGDFSAITVCLRVFTDLHREHILFSLATPSAQNDLAIFKSATADRMELCVRDVCVVLDGQEYKLNTWQSVCATWDAESGLGQLWLNGAHSSRKFISSGSNIGDDPIIILGQDQDSYGGGFDTRQSFIGMIYDVQIWDYVLPPCEINAYANEYFGPGNVLSWWNLEFETTGRVLVEEQQECFFKKK